MTPEKKKELPPERFRELVEEGPCEMREWRVEVHHGE